MKKLILIAAASLSIALATAEKNPHNNFYYTENNSEESDYYESSLSDYDDDISESDLNFDDWKTDQNESDMYIFDEEWLAAEDLYEFPYCVENDFEAEDALETALTSQIFINTTINYHYLGETYPIRVVINPCNEPLFSELAFFEVPETCSAIVIADLPIILIRHLEDRFEELKYPENVYVDLKTDSSFIEIYGDLHQVTIGTTEDAFDAEIKKIYDSKNFANEVFYYFLNDKYYKVRFINNPKKQLCEASYFDYIENEKKNFIFSWDDKYGVVTNFKTPQKYIDHWVKATYASWWDRRFNFRIENGTRSVYAIYEPGYLVSTTSTYTLDRIFHVLKNLQIRVKK